VKWSLGEVDDDVKSSVFRGSIDPLALGTMVNFSIFTSEHSFHTIFLKLDISPNFLSECYHGRSDLLISVLG
jgi:hypothetical protein